MVEQDTGGVQIDGDMVLIRIPRDRVHALRVAMQPCGCVASKSTATERTRKSFLWMLDKALGKLQARLGG